MSVRALLLIAAAVAGLGSSAQATSEAPRAKTTGIFSSMTYRNGDVVSDEAFIVLSDRGYYAVFQGSEGEPYVPVVVPIRVEGNSISFTLPASIDPRGQFRVKITDSELTGTLSGNAQTMHLKRKASYWQ